MVGRKHGSEFGCEHDIPLRSFFFPPSVYQLVIGVVVDTIQNIIRDMYACGASLCAADY